MASLVNGLHCLRNHILEALIDQLIIIRHKLLWILRWDFYAALLPISFLSSLYVREIIRNVKDYENKCLKRNWVAGIGILKWITLIKCHLHYDETTFFSLIISVEFLIIKYENSFNISSLEKPIIIPTVHTKVMWMQLIIEKLKSWCYQNWLWLG